jgi:hypothetical protein
MNQQRPSSSMPPLLLHQTPQPLKQAFSPAKPCGAAAAVLLLLLLLFAAAALHQFASKSSIRACGAAA